MALETEMIDLRGFLLYLNIVLRRKFSLRAEMWIQL